MSDGQFPPIIRTRPTTSRKTVTRRRRKVDQTALTLAVVFGVIFVVALASVIILASSGPSDPSEKAGPDDLLAATPFLIISLAFGVVVYFAPTAIGAYRGIKSIQSLAVVNVFLGWTFLGWVVALAWSFAPVERR